MKKTYIEKLILDSDEEMLRLQKQMNELLDDLKYSQEKQEKLQRELNKDTTIFSPRSRKTDMDQKLERVKNEVSVNNQRIEHIRERIEIAAKKKEEYLILLNGIDIEDNSCSELENDFEDVDLRSFLDEMNISIEKCLGFISNNGEECKRELLRMKAEVKMFSEQIENKKNRK